MNKSLSKIKPIINQAEVARRLGISPSYVCYLWSGKRTNAGRLAQIRHLIATELKALER